MQKILCSLLISVCVISCSTHREKGKVILKDVDVSRKTVNMNEDVEVSVDAKDIDETNTNVIVMINGSPCNPAVLRFNSPGIKKIFIMAKNPFVQNSIVVQTKEINVRNEVNENALSFTAETSMENPEIFEFQITEPADLTGYEFHWCFGDNTTLKTTNKFVTHDYRLRKQNSLVSSFVIAVHAEKKDAPDYSAKKSISITNLSYWSSQMGNPSVPVIYERFAALNGDAYTAQIKVNNIYTNSITFNEAEIDIIQCNGQKQKLFANVGDIFDSTEIPEQKLVERTLRLNKSLIPAGTNIASVTLTGPWSNEQKIRAKINLDIPPLLTTSGANQFETVKNRLMIEKLNKAAAIMGPGKPITPSDIKKLENEGKI